MYPLVASCFGCLLIAAPPDLETFPPANSNQWLSVEIAKISSQDLIRCGLSRAEKTAYITHKPKTFFVVQNPFQEEDPETGRWKYLTRYAKVFLLRQKSSCQEVFTCHVKGDGDMGTITSGREGVMVNAQHVYQFFCTGEADNGQFYHVHIDTNKSTVTEGPAITDMDVRNAFTGKIYR